MSGKTEIQIQVGLESPRMAKFDGIIGKALLTVEEKENELTLVFADNRYLFVKMENGKMQSNSVPE